MEYVKAPDGELDSFSDDVDIAETLERRANVSIEVDRDRQLVVVSCSENPLKARNVADAIRALRYGFDRADALSLVSNDDYHLETVEIANFTRNKKELKRQKGRVIGRDGRTRELIEELTGASVIVHDQQVSAIGNHTEISVFRQAVGMLLDGAPHGAVYHFLEQRHAEHKGHTAGEELEPVPSWRLPAD